MLIISFDGLGFPRERDYCGKDLEKPVALLSRTMDCLGGDGRHPRPGLCHCLCQPSLRRYQRRPAGGTVQPTRMKIKKATWILLIILLAGFLLRLYQLGGESLWHDEAGAIRTASMSIEQIVAQSSSNDPHPPFYYFILHYWAAFLGNSEISIRLLSLIFGLLSIAMIYIVGKLLFDRSAALIASLFLSLSQFHIYYSQEARMYSLINLLSLCSMVSFLLLLRTKKSLRIACYLLSNILLLYTHNVGFLIIAAQNIFMLTLFFRFRKVGEFTCLKWIILQTMPVLFFLPWLKIVITQWMNIQKNWWMRAPSLRSIQQTLLDYSGGTVLYVLFVALVIIAVLMSFLTTQNKREKLLDVFKFSKRKARIRTLPEIYLCMVWLFSPIIILFLISKVSRPIYIIRVTIAASPALYLLAAQGIKSIRNKIIQIIVGSIIVFLLLISLQSYYTQIKKTRWREAVKYIESGAQSGDLLIFNLGCYSYTVFNYYSTRNDIVKRSSPTGDFIDDTNIHKFAKILPKQRRVWLILCQSHDRQGLMKKELGKSFDQIDYRRFPYHSFQAHGERDIEVFLFEKSGRY
jgi:mannosyltransferase